MNIKLIDILTYSGLKNARAIAGVRGLSRVVKRVSVYDRDFVNDFTHDQGVLYISSLHHFRDNKEKVLSWMESLYGSGTCGLILVEEALELVSDDVITYCNSVGFPIVVIDNETTYADIIEHVSILLYFNNLSVKKAEIIDSILYNRLSEKEKIDNLKLICPNVNKLVLVMAIAGNLISELYERELNDMLDLNKGAVYIPLEDKKIIIISENSDTALIKKTETAEALIKPYFVDLVIGEGKVHHQKDIDKAINSAITSLSIAKLNKTDFEKYNDFSDLALFLTGNNSEELMAFHEKFLNTIGQSDPNGKMEYIECVRQYVINKGDYSKVSDAMFQSENTIRYRINKVKYMLGFADDTIKFNEIISIFVAIDRMISG